MRALLLLLLLTSAPLALAQTPTDARQAYERGRAAFRAEHYEEAAREFERAAELDPESSLYHTWRGNAYGMRALDTNPIHQATLARKAKAAFDQAVQLDPNNLNARESLARFYSIAPAILGGSRTKAVQQIEEIRQRNPYRGTMLLAELHSSENRLAEAARLYFEVVEAHPDSLAPLQSLGRLYQEAQQWENAFTIYDRILLQAPGNPTALYQTGRTAAISGERLERGEEALRDYLDYPPAPDQPSHAAAHWRLGLIYEERGDPVRARQEYEAALRLDPEFEEAQEALRALES